MSAKAVLDWALGELGELDLEATVAGARAGYQFRDAEKLYDTRKGRRGQCVPRNRRGPPVEPPRGDWQNDHDVYEPASPPGSRFELWRRVYPRARPADQAGVENRPVRPGDGRK